MEVLKFDVLILGSGIAGLRAAIQAALKGVQVAIITKTTGPRSNSICAEAGIAAVVEPLKTGDSPELHAYDTVRGGEFLVDQDAALLLAEEAPKEVEFLASIGVPWTREDGSYALRRLGGMSRPRTVYVGDRTGLYITSALYKHARTFENISFFEDHFVTSIIVHNGEFRGFTAIDLRKGELKVFLGKAGIIATGGGGRMFKFTSMSLINTGEAYGMALRAGLALKDMEFVQWHPTALVPSGVLITEAVRGEGAILLNRLGERFMARYAPKELELAPRDIVSRAIALECLEGRGVIDEETGLCHVWLDLRRIDVRRLRERFPQLLSTLERAGLDPSEDLIPVRPAVHYFMGGIHVDSHGRALDASGKWIKGLWAAGEAACISVHGANRLGSNSLSECLVWGRITGDEAGEYAKRTIWPGLDGWIKDFALKEESRIFDGVLHKEVNAYSTQDVLDELQRLMDEALGVLRHGRIIEEALQRIKKIEGEIMRVRISDRSRVYNLEFCEAIALRDMALAAKAMLIGAYMREESRGAHYRLDHPQRDDANWLRHTLLYLSNDKIEISYEPVRIVKWRP